MHVAVDLNWFLQFIGFAFAAVFGLLFLVRNTASKYFVVDSNFDSSAADYSLDQRKNKDMAAPECADTCAVCGLVTTKHCAGCKMVKYCSGACQKSHWASGHKVKCKELQSFYRANNTKSRLMRERKTRALLPSSGYLKQSNEILFPYEKFVEYFNWDKQGYPPCGLLNCGNSCFANVVLQCLTYTRPLVAYLLEKGHKTECQKNDWCFFCEFQTHVERVSRSFNPFSPINILSRLPNIGGNLGYGKQEDAHEFMRFAIDNMQSACLDKFGGEKAIHPSCQETTLIQHIFGGRLQSQVICTECSNVSNQFENMMDLTVEINGDAGSLEECLDQFTAKEQLHGDNMYKCDSCNAYVMAWKRLLIQRAPNILTIALKRFQSGRFGKLNKRVTFPETLDLGAYMSDLIDGSNVYKLYAVIVHVDMLNASFFGHYICYVKDFRGNWYRIDDCKVANVDLDEVLSQGAYMLLYSRIRARPSCLLPDESSRKEENKISKIQEINLSPEQPVECLGTTDDPEQPSSSSGLNVNCDGEPSISDAEPERGGSIEIISTEPNSFVNDVGVHCSDGLSSPREVASPLRNQPNSGDTPMIDKSTSQFSVPRSELCLMDSVEYSSCGSKCGEDDLSSQLVEESYAAANGVVEKGNNACDVSDSTMTIVEAPDETNPSSYTSMPANVISNNVLPRADHIQDATNKSDGEICATKLKPIFAPGFLGKRPRKKCINPGDKVSAEFSDLTPKSYQSNQTNEVAKPRSLSENGGFLRNE